MTKSQGYAAKHERQRKKARAATPSREKLAPIRLRAAVIALAGDVKVVVATQPVDFRRGINGLVALVAAALAADPYCGDVFVFRPSAATGCAFFFGTEAARSGLEMARIRALHLAADPRRLDPVDARGVRASGGWPRLDEGGEETRQKACPGGVK